jgi:hypothetical protein
MAVAHAGFEAFDARRMPLNMRTRLLRRNLMLYRILGKRSSLTSAHLPAQMAGASRCSAGGNSCSRLKAGKGGGLAV